MATNKVNLLPPEHAVSGSAGKLFKILTSLNVILLAGLIVFLLGLTALFVFLSAQLSGSKNAVSGLKSQIASLEVSEQQAVLLKDRLGKIKAVEGVPGSFKNLANADTLFSALGPNSSLSELELDSQKIDASLAFKSNSDLSEMIKKLRDSQVFKLVVLTSFGFNPFTGYLASLHLI